MPSPPSDPPSTPDLSSPTPSAPLRSITALSLQLFNLHATSELLHHTLRFSKKLLDLAADPEKIDLAKAAQLHWAAEKMAAVRVRPQGSCSMVLSEPLHCCYKFRGGATTTPCSVSFASKFQSLCCKSQLLGKSNSRGGFSRIDVVSGGELIKRFDENGNCEDAIVVYVKMLQLGLPEAEEFQFFPILIKAFGGFCDVGKAREIHGHVLKLGVLGDVYDANSILGVYWKCGEVEDAVQMFEKMPERDLVSWNTMISGFCHSGDYQLLRCIWEVQTLLQQLLYEDLDAANYWC
ncbi:pentatricopeptide repeat-containing protein At2g29760, chloroplastic-like [Rosa rugosa]|uniref:pentatricopeptide repeat-containing protein At2g29760, chloroplastic-like n=1 Tax=Rosa rugosa TaxID=74645 RepID=UPI002B405549|nr:pentatricopeptide repeat-containing protein At2g29760, chloroplastic-like [Rosa rugosa]